MASVSIIEARYLIDGLSDRVIDYPRIVVEGKSVKEVLKKGEESDCYENAEIIDLGDCTLLPGLIDSHIHMTLGTSENYHEVIRESDGVHLATGIVNSRAALIQGITTIVDAGSRNFVAHDLREASKKGIIETPNLLIAGRPLTITGGHFWFCNDNEADGCDQVRRRVRQFVKENIDILKVMASGGGSARQGSMGGPTASMVAYNVNELKASVEEAHKLGRIVTAHCEAYESVYNAASAGVDVLAHCGFIMPDGERGFDEEAVKLMATKKLYYNPTLQTGSARFDELKKRGESGTLALKDKDALEVLEYKFQKKFENLRRIIDQGVEIVAGSDASGMGNSTRLIRALEMMHEAGMSRIQVIRSATSIAAKALKMDDKLGSIKPGVEADILGVNGNVSLDLSSLRKTRFVMKSGVKIVN
jgi:imidazolonepropionase-like amidohydrolase